MKKILAIVIILSMALSVPIFADTTTPTTIVVETTTTQAPGITPDSILYSLDKLMERIQLVLITDAVKEAETLAKIAQERLAESNAMAEKSEIELTQKALEEYKTNLSQAVTLIETAMADGKQVANAMEDINDANLKDAAVVEKILASIPEQFREEVKVEIEKLAAATEAATEVAQVVENKEEEENNVKLEITLKYIEEKVQDPALIAKLIEAELNTRQIIAVISLSEQSGKPLAEVIDLFVTNEKGIGVTSNMLGLTTKDALKGINESFKDTKATIKQAFKEAMKAVDEEDKDVVEALVNESLAVQTITTERTRTTEQLREVEKKLEKVMDDAKQQVAAIATQEKKTERIQEKAMEQIEKTADKATEKAEKIIEKATDKTNDTENNNHSKDDSKAQVNGKVK
ncbi:MAG: DUF5667 domain-containing protein [Lutisporaceae bacterium]